METMSKYEAYTAMRILMRMQEQIDRAIVEHRVEDAMAIAKTFGSVEYRIFGEACFVRSDMAYELFKTEEVAWHPN